MKPAVLWLQNLKLGPLPWTQQSEGCQFSQNYSKESYEVTKEEGMAELYVFCKMQREKKKLSILQGMTSCFMGSQLELGVIVCNHCVYRQHKENPVNLGNITMAKEVNVSTWSDLEARESSRVATCMNRQKFSQVHGFLEG